MAIFTRDNIEQVNELVESEFYLWLTMKNVDFKGNTKCRITVRDRRNGEKIKVQFYVRSEDTNSVNESDVAEYMFGNYIVSIRDICTEHLMIVQG